jgi:predicted nuclease of predicted toxin-antitoxin system
MKLLLDSCVWGKAVDQLTQLGHDVDWVGNWEKDPGDEEILKYAHRRKYVLVTLDKDFGELAIVHQKPHSGIIRLVNISATKQAEYCHNVLSKFQKELSTGAIITVDNTKVRIRLNR